VQLQLAGNLDADSVPALWQRYRSVQAAELIDLAQVQRVDSAGVAFVRQLQLRCRAAGCPTRLQNLPAHFIQLQQAHRLQSIGDADG
jgi:phospholipid transport system transporter-binding protein